LTNRLAVIPAIALTLAAAACSSEVSGQPTGQSPVLTSVSAASSTRSSATATGQPSGGGGPTETGHTLVLGTNQLGTHQFNLDTGYDPVQIAGGVEFVLTRPAPSGYALEEVGSIKCPPGVPVVAGTSFDCTLEVDDQSKVVTVDIVSDQGWYIVGMPR